MIYHKKQPDKRPPPPPAPPPPNCQRCKEPCSCVTEYAKWCEDMVGRLYYARIAMSDKRINELLDEISKKLRK